MSRFNCQVGEAIEFPRQQERRIPKKDKCCGFVGATVVADAFFDADDEIATGELIPLTANTTEGFNMLSANTFNALRCGTYSVTVKVRTVSPGNSPTEPAMISINKTGCGPTTSIGTVNVPEARGTSLRFVTVRVCLREGEGINLTALQPIEPQGNDSVNIFLSIARLSDCCDSNGNGTVGSCRSCSCDKCDKHKHRDDHHDDHHDDHCDRC